MALTDWNEGFSITKMSILQQIAFDKMRNLKISLLQNGNERMIVDIGRGWNFYDVKQ